MRLQVPAEWANAECEVTVTVRPHNSKQAPASDPEWLGFIEETAGRWQGGPLVRESEGECEVREELT